jgi:2-oxoglutarate dehydrogenase E1 component
MNMGGWSYVLPRFFPIFSTLGRSIESGLKYAGRNPSAATATGFGEVRGFAYREGV